MTPDVTNAALPGSGMDPKALEFVKKLSQKTLQGKLKWEPIKTGNGFITGLPDNVVAYFASTTQPPFEWSSLNVQSGKRVLLQVRKSMNDVILMITGSSTDPLQVATHELFRLIVGTQENPLDTALKSIDKL